MTTSSSETSTTEAAASVVDEGVPSSEPAAGAEEETAIIPGDPLESMLVCDGPVDISDPPFEDPRVVLTPLEVAERLLIENSEGDIANVWNELSAGKLTESERVTIIELVNLEGTTVGLVEALKKQGGWDVGSSALCFA